MAEERFGHCPVETREEETIDPPPSSLPLVLHVVVVDNDIDDETESLPPASSYSSPSFPSPARCSTPLMTIPPPPTLFSVLDDDVFVPLVHPSP